MKSNILTIFSVGITLLIVAFVLMFYLQEEHVLEYEPDLKEDGICILRDVFTSAQLDELVKICSTDDYKIAKENIIGNVKLLDTLKKKTGEGYVFHDYIFVIKKSAIHTCHRDSNGDMFNDILNPSYTMILFLEDMDKCLGVIPSSHKDKHSFEYNFTNKVKQVLCKKGDILLFNANIIHAGSLNEGKPDALRIQMKFSHKDDLHLLDYYSNYNKILKKENTNPFYMKKIQQNASCMITTLAGSNTDIIKNNKNVKNDNDIPIQEKMFAYLFYGKSDYYNLPNAF